jgi:Domain of unknown function (DUF4232)
MIYRRISLISAGLALATAACAPGGSGAAQPPTTTAPAVPVAATSAPAASAPSPEATLDTERVSQPSAPPAVRATGPCRAADLSLNAIRAGAAMGTIGHEIVVTNTGGRPCSLLGDPAKLVYPGPAGVTTALPTRPTGTRAGNSVLEPGERAVATVLTVNGFGGYDPADAECAHPTVYRNLSVRLSGDSLLLLKGLVLDVKCGDIQVSGWHEAATS